MHAKANRELILPDDPLWFKDAIFYQLHLKAFFDSNADGYGDIPGLIQKLDYVQNLGINCIWLLPFYPSPLRDDGYDISDYKAINPVYGTRKDFKNLVREAHRRGIRIMTEFVLNHTSDQHPWFQAARQAPPGSTKRDYYVWSDNDQKYAGVRIIFKDFETSNWTWDPVAKAYFWHRFFHHQPDLNYENPHVVKAIMRVMRFWFDMGVDGMRLDAVPYLTEQEGTSCQNLPETHAILKEMRKILDENYKNRVLLAEANLWPEDVREFFGDGDECQMAFHFPLMPRIFMAVHQENRHPITEILARTPQIPDNCQWATFLRNHDELTLEMVTDEERDYMYKAYASDPLMRLNLGIRRRLSTLMEYSRPRIELLNSLLFSLPGTPIIYYGDEIGMGDNVFLGDRHSIRTPMQWTPDRNGGFSTAPFARLYCPPNMDPVTGYQALSVESQTLDRSSMLNWMKDLIRLRKQHKVFGRGTLEFLSPSNQRVLAYVRRYQDEIVLVVANLSRYPQSAELDLSQYEGLTPVELFGLGHFHRIDDKPYIITLGPYSFYWLGLQLAPETIVPKIKPRPPAEAPAAVASSARKLSTVFKLKRGGPWKVLLGEELRELLERDVLPAYVARQHWFAGKTPERVRLADIICLQEGADNIFFVPIEVGEWERYAFFLSIVDGDAADQMYRSAPETVLAKLVGESGYRAVIYEASANPSFYFRLLRLLEGNERIDGINGSLRAGTTDLFRKRIREDEHPPVRCCGPETHNTLLFYDDKLMLKIYRRLEAGKHPEYEVLHHLREKTAFSRVPGIAGTLEYDHPQGSYLIGLAEEYINNQAGGWDYTVDELRRFLERAGSHMFLLDKISAESVFSTKFDLELIRTIDDMLGIYLFEVDTLGTRTAELHLALSQPTGEEAFEVEVMSSQDLSDLSCNITVLFDRATTILQERMEGLPGQIGDNAEQIVNARQKIFALAESAKQLKGPFKKIRCHSDLHLGQVLWSNGDFVIIDFEGEPSACISERVCKKTPLVDVAGMLRSFSYAIYVSLLIFVRNQPQELKRMRTWARICYAWLSNRFLKSYFELTSGTLYECEQADLKQLLRLLLLKKALEEICLEAVNRPEWLRYPLLGLADYLAADSITVE